GHSTGAFTLDLERSRATLQHFQLPSAYHYVLPLVACAVAGGADSLSIFSDQHRRIVDLDGLAVNLEGGGAVSSYLHAALAAAGRLAHTDVFGESRDGQAGFRFRLAGTQLLISPLPEQQHSVRTRLILTPLHPWENRLFGAVRWLAGLGPAADPAAELLKAYSRYSSVPIRLNSRQLNLEWQGHWKLLGVLNRPPLQLRPQTALRQVTVCREVPFAGYLGLGVGGGGALVIVDGLLYPLDLPGASPEFRAILWHSALQRDLSMLRLVENQELERFRQTVVEILTGLIS
ncbi:MAG: hypothetical protein KIS61_34005, partial [Candidatus Eremiobacteraeota bacterium]|nr:hypothetical protein [Candidatus Eremiobacteraeota bacterium]